MKIINQMFAVRTVLLLLVGVLTVGCSSSQEDVLGTPPMTTEQVMDDVLYGGGEAEKWRENATLLSRDGAEQYHNEGWAQSAWDKQASYLKNEQLILYYSPKRDDVGGIRPGYVYEIPLYRQVHLSWSEE
ncbi:hypothetical protein [Vibrio harveyi]|uniref:hypothetical protein n=1 Tax=Vibrio harveyi TaxID=669 RepID=UPI001EFD29A9|nr:hypothetical protein [Vibrio harveyi]MCG9589954.1 hypothetical protein [Vibrio harveyi]WJT11004.1 hypothetical protein PH545_28825 [Vibrio harveyi]